MALRAVTDHPKFARLKVLLKLSKFQALGCLEGIWHFCAKYTPSGAIGKYADADIEAWVEWDGEEGKLIFALIKSGWIDEDTTHRLLVHDWPQHADVTTHTELARKLQTFADGTKPQTGRLNKSERERFNSAFPSDEVRPKSDSLTDTSGLDQTKSDISTKPVPEPEPEPVPEPEINTLAPSALALEAVAASSPAIGTIPLVDGTNWSFTQEDVDSWKEAFPAVDVLQQLREMREWFKAHTNRRKTKRGIRGFVTAWLGREQDKGRSKIAEAPVRRYIA